MIRNVKYRVQLGCHDYPEAYIVRLPSEPSLLSAYRLKMVKEFRIVLTSPEDGRVIENRVCDVTGYVLVVTDKPKTGYEAIKVSLRGNANVKFTIGANGSNPRTYESHVAYMDVVADVWRKEDVPGGQLEAGSHRFPFSLRFQANLQSGCELPRSFYHQFEEVGRVGNIVYRLGSKN